MAALPSGAFITSINGKRCTAVPKPGASSKASENVETQSAAAAAASTTATANSVAQFTAAVITSPSAQDESPTPTSTAISTSPSLTSSITKDPPAPAQQQAQASVQAAPAVIQPSPAPEPSPTTTTSIPTFAPISSQKSQPAQTDLSSAQVQTSQTDALETALATQTTQTTQTTADTTANSAAASLQQGTALPDVTSSPALSESVAPLFTTIGTAPGPSNSAAADATASTGPTNGAANAVPVANNGSAIQSTVAVAGGVIGGVLLVSMLAFFGWWWRRRSTRKRRSTLLTPLTIVNSNLGPDEKGEYVINRGSIGPTPRSERFKAALGYNMRKINGSISRIVTRGSTRGSTAPSVNMNRGNSQFMEGPIIANRPGSVAATGNGTGFTAKDRLMGWWARLTADSSFNWRLKNQQNPNSDDLFGSPRGMNEKRAGGGSGGGGSGPPGTAPDFLTLLGMDDRELDREAQRRRMSPSRQNGGSASSSDRFLGGGGLGLNFGSGSDDDPFSDANAIAHISAKPAPLVVSQGNNPFSDANAVRPPGGGGVLPKPGSYVAEMRRSRGQSLGGPQQRPPSSTVGGGYRESGASVESFGTRRNKFRSDPFDLERPELLGRTGGSMSSSAGATVGSGSRVISGGVGVDVGEIRRPPGARTRADSFTSKYSSGVSLEDWSDPGPDVGPAAAKGGWDGPEQRESPTQGWRTRLERENAASKARRMSGGSQGSVGKAM